jgi:hypothetical protein
MMKKEGQQGQALVEYLIILLFLGVIGGKVVVGIRDFMSGNIGNLNHVLSQNLKVGVCAQDCFFGNYRNGNNAP